MAKFSGPQNLIALGIAFAIGLGGGAALVHFFVTPSRESIHGDTSGSRAVGGRVAARGRLEPATGVINLAAPSPDILKKIDVKEGQDVAENQQLAILASHDLREIESDMARIQLKE